MVLPASILLQISYFAFQLPVSSKCYNFPQAHTSKNSGSILQALWAMAGNIITDQKGSLEALPLDFIVYFFYRVLLLHSSFFSLPIKNTGVVLNHVQLFATPWTAVCQAPLSMGFSRQEYWSGLPFPTPGHLPDPGIKPVTPVSAASADGFFTKAPLGKPKQKWTADPVPSRGNGSTFIYLCILLDLAVLCVPQKSLPLA